MKPLSPPDIKGRTPWERMDNALRTVLKVSKDTILKEESKEKQAKERKKQKKRG